MCNDALFEGDGERERRASCFFGALTGTSSRASRGTMLTDRRRLDFFREAQIR
jgi:hypothetical protein